MGSSSLPSFIQISTFSQKLTTPQNSSHFSITKRNTQFSCSLSPSPSHNILQKSLPLAASIAILLWSTPGISGLEAVPGPQLPKIDFLSRINEENQKRYAENDARIKESPLVKKLLEQSKLNKEKNSKEIENKYCLRGAEWGVGDCSAEGMSIEEREKFIAMLKEKVGEK
ncbi:unnamed protein product [Lathyrus oleraceus]